VLTDAAEQVWLVAIREARQRGPAQRAVTTARTCQGFTTRKGTALRLMQTQRIIQQTHIA